MRFDFWNNPQVVSAFRVKYRRGGLFVTTTLYLAALTMLGVVLEYYNQTLFPGLRWQDNYFLALLGIQYLVSCMTAASATASSMKSEVANRTLDFQRIAALTPRQILLGKLLGEPAMAYLLAIASFPLAVWCLILGAAGLTLPILLLIYLNLFTTMVLLGTVGLIHRLDVQEGKPAGGGGGIWTMLGVLTWVGFSAGPALARFPWFAAAVGLLTPVPLFRGVASHTPWQPSLGFFGGHVPLLVVAPLAQLLVAFLCFRVMVRRLINPLNPPFGKPMAYAVLMIVDLIASGVLYETGPAADPAEVRVAGFCLVHFLTSLLLVINVTPGRQSLQSWVWRFRGRSPRLWDMWLGDRSENGLVLVTFCGIGLVLCGLLVLLPAGLDQIAIPWEAVLPILASTSLLILAFGGIHQWLLFISGGSGVAPLLMLTVILVGIPHAVGHYYHLELVEALSPSAQFISWLNSGPGGPPLPWYPLAILYGVLTAAAWLSFRGHLARLEKAVDHKLQSMGVPVGKA
jgi:hypothetical protein